MKNKLFYFFLFLSFASCIGVDTIDDPIVGASISIADPKQVALMKDDTHPIEAEYFDQYGIKQDVAFTWISSMPSVASVDPNGIVTAKEAGQADIHASFNGKTSEAVSINVVLSLEDVAKVQIASAKTILDVNEKITLSIVVKNINNDVLEGHTAEWFTNNPSVVTVNSTTGEVTAVGNGIGRVYAKVDGVKSNSLDLMVGSGRMGSFVSGGSYKAKGKAFLEFNGGTLSLTLSDDFETSYALGTFIYLANSTNGADVAVNGLELMQITADGAHTFNVSAAKPGAQLFDYRYVVILCKPAKLTFGYADLN